MLKEDFIQFGDKEKFAIEVRPIVILKQVNLRLWFEGNGFGNTNSKGTCDYIIDGYFRLLSSFKILYEEKFGRMTDSEIFTDIFYSITVDRPFEEEKTLFERQQKFSFEFGDNQFNNITFIIIYVETEKIFKFLLYEMDGKFPPKLHSFKIDSHYFFGVYKKFVVYAYENDLKKHVPFFPVGFSESLFE